VFIAALYLINKTKENTMPDQNKTIRPKSQALSDAIMKFRYVELEAMEAALDARNALLDLQDELMNEGRLDGMDASTAAKSLWLAASGSDAAREVHFMLREIGRKIGEQMPVSPTYSQEYIDLSTKIMGIRLSSKPRR
jgi:hypothetical protein